MNANIMCASSGQFAASIRGHCAHCLLALGLSRDEELTEIKAGVSDSGDSLESSGRFAPGAVFYGGRFRITGFAARGGMGEVYRALDLKLGDSVALKFIANERPTVEAVRRFYDEVRLARQVAHPSVCRVYELLDVDGLPFIVMEYVEGETLASLIARIGTLPYRTAVRIAREICAGVSAAHERGILHGDLKPGNVMIDDRGHVRITDFGLARLATDAEGRARGGTIAYMAPEQLNRLQSSERTDLYSLGVLLYELFTGRHPGCDAGHPPPRPSLVQPRLHREIERVILHCLATEPSQRPQSARAILTALGGGDSLDAFTAGGETPSPEYVAASRRVPGLRPAEAWTIAASAAALMVTLLFLSDRLTLYGQAQLTKPPAALAKHAREIATHLAGVTSLVDEGYWFEPNASYTARRAGGKPEEYGALPSIVFHYRASPVPLAPAGVDGVLRQDDPPPAAGMVHVMLTPAGRLVGLESLAPLTKRGPPPVADLLHAAQIAPPPRPITPTSWAPHVPHDALAEWRDGPAAVRAAFAGSHVSAFEVSPASSNKTVATRSGARLAESIYNIMLVVTVIAGVFLARHNLRLRRVDRKGAVRLTAWVFVCRALYGLLGSHHPLSLDQEPNHIASLLGAALLMAVEVLIAYVALEPFVRRRWPALMIGWMRFGQGRIRDAVVAREVLAGLIAGLLFRLLDQVRNAAPLIIPSAQIIPSERAVDALGSFRTALATLFQYHAQAIFYALFALFLLLLLRMVSGSDHAAMLLWVVATTAMFTRWGDPRIDVPVVAIQMIVLLTVIRRFGLLSLIAAVFVALLTVEIPLTLTPSRFYFASSLLAVAVIVSLVALGIAGSMSHRRTPAIAPAV